MADFGKSFGGGRRSAGRSQLAEQGVATTRSSCSSVAVVDISRTGAKLRGIGEVAVGDDILLKLGKFNLFGNVRWVRDNLCGVEFDGKISRYEFLDLRQKEWDGFVFHANREQKLALEDWNSSLVR